MGRDLPTDIAILLGYRADLTYRTTTDQGTVAYLRAVELTAQARRMEAPIFDSTTLDVFDESLLGSDSNIHELIREQVVSDQQHKEKSDLVQGVKPEEGRLPVYFVNNKRFYMDGDAQRQRYPALRRGFDAIWERENEFVQAYRKSPLYVDEAHEKAFMVPASMLHPMIRTKEQIISFQRAFGEQK